MNLIYNFHNVVFIANAFEFIEKKKINLDIVDSILINIGNEDEKRFVGTYQLLITSYSSEVNFKCA